MSESSAPVTDQVPAPKRTGLLAPLDRYFKVSERGSNFAREIRGGLATFFAMAYIVVLNPLIIGTAPDINGDTLGIPQVAAVTALVAAVSSMLMGVISRYPFAIASGMGLNAILAYVLAPMMTWSDVMGLVVIEGVIMLVLVLTGFRNAVFNAVPPSLKSAIGVGVGLFLALIGFVNAGFVQPGSGTPVQLGVGGSLDGWPILVFVLGLVATIILMVRKVKGAVLIGIVFATVLGIVVEALAKVGPKTGADGTVNEVGWSLTVPEVPTSVGDLVSLPDLSLVGQFNLLADWKGVGIATMLMLLLTLLLADFFDTMGTMVGVASQAGLTDEEGNVPNAQGVLVADAIGTVAGGLASASVATTYAESAAGVGEGARTGIASIVTGLLFLGALFITPLAALVPFEAATPVLIVVGFMMMTQITRVDFSDLGIGIPAFLAIVVMPYTYSIANGIGVAFIAYTVVRLAQGRWRDVHPLMLVVSLVFLIHFSEAALQGLIG